MDILSKANSIVSEYDKIIKQMMDNDIMLNQEKMTLLSREKSALDDSYQLCKQYIDLNNQLSELDEMRNDKEYEELAKEESIEVNNNLISIEKLKFSKVEIAKIKLLRKWHCFLENKNIVNLNELDRFKLHQELEMFLPSFIFYLPQNLRLNWLNRWRDKEDKLFHPSNLVNGDVIKKYLKIEDGPILGELLQYLSKELAFKRLNNFDEAIYKAKQWIEQNAPKCD